MQDRTLALVLVLILAICCLGMYVAVSGFLNINSGLSFAQTTIPAGPATLIVVVINTPTAVAPTSGPTNVPATSPAVPSPLGALQTIMAPTLTPVPGGSAPTPLPTAPIPPTKPPQPATASCSGFAYCASTSPPDPKTEVGGDTCPRNYIIGRVLDAGGRGIANVRVTFRIPSGETSSTLSKDSGDELGKYDIPALGASPTVWVVWLADPGGAKLSPEFKVIVPQVYTGSGNCPTRVDFRAQR